MMSQLDPKNCRVALLAGGKSDEREISIASGDGAQDALESAGFIVERLDPADNADLKMIIDGGFDVAFLCLHGRDGEDGTIQGFLELLGIPYTCSGVFSSSLCMDKSKAKVFYEKAGLATPPSLCISAEDDLPIEEVGKKIGYPCVIKPVAEGSALGVSIVEGPDEVKAALEEVFSRDEYALIEKYISGMELTVAVLGNEDPFALPIIEIIPRNEFYDFDSKYAPGGCQHICPARIDENLTKQVQAMAIDAHLCLSCSGVSRSDILLDQNNKPWILETNTIPGMTKTSLLPDAASVAGISFPELCRQLIGYALESYSESHPQTSE
ncbi:MAG: D-alanine--D-alanine ligase [Eggerthellaceae bacterium]|nr:D-alanine--D-alanine ligase [Eggerthellaceae bacterium]